MSSSLQLLSEKKTMWKHTLKRFLFGRAYLILCKKEFLLEITIITCLLPPEAFPQSPSEENISKTRRTIVNIVPPSQIDPVFIIYRAKRNPLVISKYLPCSKNVQTAYDAVSDVVESGVHWRSDFQIGSRETNEQRGNQLLWEYNISVNICARDGVRNVKTLFCKLRDCKSIFVPWQGPAWPPSTLIT